MNGLNIYTVAPIGDGRCAFLCPKCAVWHVHSMPSLPGVPEHRAKHCDKRKNPGGYFIVTPPEHNKAGT